MLCVLTNEKGELALQTPHGAEKDRKTQSWLAWRSVAYSVPGQASNLSRAALGQRQLMSQQHEGRARTQRQGLWESRVQLRLRKSMFQGGLSSVNQLAMKQ